MLQQLPAGTLAAAYAAIEVTATCSSMGGWLQYQSPWADMGAVEELLGDELDRWQQLVLEIKADDPRQLDGGEALKLLAIDYSTSRRM